MLSDCKSDFICGVSTLYISIRCSDYAANSVVGSVIIEFNSVCMDVINIGREKSLESPLSILKTFTAFYTKPFSRLYSLVC